MDWFNAIRCTKFRYLQVAFPGAPTSEVSICTHSPSHMYTLAQHISDVKDEWKTSRRAFVVSIHTSLAILVLVSEFFFAYK